MCLNHKQVCSERLKIDSPNKIRQLKLPRVIIINDRCELLGNTNQYTYVALKHSKVLLS